MRIMGCRNIYPFQYRIEQAHKFCHKYQGNAKKYKWTQYGRFALSTMLHHKPLLLISLPPPFANMTLQSREELGSVLVVYYRQDWLIHIFIQHAAASMT